MPSTMLIYTYHNSTYITRVLKTSSFPCCITQWCTPCIKTAPAHLIIWYSILVTMVTHNFLPKWFSWQLKSCGMSTITLLTRMVYMVTVGLKMTKLQSEMLLYSGILSAILPDFTSTYL